MSTTKESERRGSTWSKWDLHLHAPGTKLGNSYGIPDDSIWKSYIEALEASDVQVFGITDYFSFNSYFETIQKYQEYVPNGSKLLIPNIEFRLTETVSIDGKNVNTHVLLDPKVATPEKLRTFLTDLETHITSSGKRIRCYDLAAPQFAEATVSINDIQRALETTFSTEHYLIVTASGNDGLRGTAKGSQRSQSISDELDKVSDAFFGKSGSVNYFLKKDRYKDGSESQPKPIFDSSDAHSIDDLSRLTGDEPSFQSTWIKADLSFRGLRQTIFEPQYRVFIGDRPSVLIRQEREATKFIDKLELSSVVGYNDENGKWFNKVNILFNPELTAIIGNKGSGKSAVADIVALLGETRQAKYFSFLTDTQGNKKFRRPGFADKFHGKLTWSNGDTTSRSLDSDPDLLRPEAVKYLPQHYFESLTNEIEVQELRREIEDVVFSHVDETEQMGVATFGELVERTTANSKHEASALKVKLRELNIKIVELEEQAAAPYRAKLFAELNDKRSDLKSLESSKPKEVAAPASESPDQKYVADQISKLQAKLSAVTTKGREASAQLVGLKSKLQSLLELTEQINGIKGRIDREKEELRERCVALEIEIDRIISARIDITPLNTLIASARASIAGLELNGEISFALDTDFDILSSVPDLRAGHRYLSDAIIGRRETLSAPQQRYQKYVQAIREITEKIELIVGDKNSPKPGTIADLEARLERVDNTLAPELESARQKRISLCREIFECKKKVRTFYESVKGKVETRLKAIPNNDLSVSIDASFVPSIEFSEDFFSHLNRNVSGPFRGIAEGAREFQKLIASIDWNELSSILTALDSVMDAIKKDGIEKQVRDIKTFYDFLFSFEYFEAKYALRLGGKDLNQLSPGEKGLLLLVFYLHLDRDNTPLVIDQPEDNLDNEGIFSVLAHCIREAKKIRQVILVTHNPNLAVGADAEEILYVRLDKVNNYHFSYESGAIENPRINDHIVRVLEGTRPAFVQRRLRYQIV